MRYAIVHDGTVENVVLWDGEADWTAPEGCDLVALSDDQRVGAGDTYDGEAFTAAPAVAPVPSEQTVTVDPQALTDAQTAVNSATTVAQLRKAVAAALNLLNPN